MSEHRQFVPGEMDPCPCGRPDCRGQVYEVKFFKPPTQVALESEVAALRLKCAALEAALRRLYGLLNGDIGAAMNRERIVRESGEALSGEPTALREMMERAASEAYERCGVAADEAGYSASAIVDRILKGGGR